MKDSVCELPLPGVTAPTSPPSSRVVRFHAGASVEVPHTWEGVPLTEYKPAADHHWGVLRSVLVGQSGEATSFHVRYFEVGPGGHTTVEHHAHEHVVIILRGRGEVQLGEEVHEVGYGDLVYVAPHGVHQLRNPHEEPFGFLCMVDAQRDKPVPVSE
jgi:quercetin dioxygenase-like cupin family protein